MTDAQVDALMQLASAKGEDQWYIISLLLVALVIVVALLAWRLFGKIERDSRRYDDAIKAIQASMAADSEQNALLSRMSQAVEGTGGALRGTGLQLASFHASLEMVESLLRQLIRDGHSWHVTTRNHFEAVLDNHHAEVVRSISEQAAVAGGIHVPFPPEAGLHFDWTPYLVRARLEGKPIRLYRQPVWDDKNLLMTFSEPTHMRIISGYMEAFFAAVVVTSDSVPIKGWLNKEAVVLEAVFDAVEEAN